MINVVNISKAYGSETLFSDISFDVNPGERIGLVGRNGHGKTTLLRMMIGEETPDSGTISIARGYRLGYLTQILNFSRDRLIDEACLSLPEYQKHDRWRAEKILSGLGFTKTDLDHHPQSFSGGYQVRLNLARTLLSEPDALLLDEPTNFLDVISIRWLSAFLNQWQKELILITHDRSFMDSVITHTIGIHRKKIKKIPGTTAKYYERVQTEEIVHEKTRRNEEKKRRETEEFITRFRAKARLAGLVQSRVKALEKQAPREKLEGIQGLDFSFQYEPFPAKTPLQVSELTFGYQPESTLIENLDLVLGKQDRLGVIGKNGSGKTTLLRLLAKELSPDNGRITLHPAVRSGYYAQTNRRLLNDNETIEESLMNAGCKRQKARDICGTLMFSGDLALKRIGVLSGGEKSRVLLGRLLASPVNLLLLDEPTNHLDMDSCNAFLEAIDNFPGAVILVTHNEMFLHRLTSRLVVFQSDGVRLFEGGYRDFLEKVGWEEEGGKRPEQPPKQKPDQSPDQSPETPRGKSDGVVSKKESRQQRAEILKRRSRIINPLQKRITATETAVEEKEARAEELNAAMVSASTTGDGPRVAELSRQHHQLRSEIDQLYERLDSLCDELEAGEKKFDRELDESGG
ncbi:MAG: ATP-binding cassette domain-containing protein [Desulfosudaceae bacterium]